MMEIHLDSPNRGYLPGALVRGEVELDLGTNGEQGTLSIAFSGRSMIELKAWSVGPGDYGRNTQFLMTSKLILYQGSNCHTDMPAGGYPFLFTFPSKTHDALGQSIWSDSAKYGSPKNWPHQDELSLLPPALSFTGGPILSATIEYRLDAKWVSSTRQERRSIVLPFDTYRSEHSPCDISVSATDHFSLRGKFQSHMGVQHCPSTITNRVHMALNSESIRTKRKFSIETKIGTRIVQGAVPLVELRVSFPEQISSATGLFNVRLRFLNVHLERIMAVRTPRRAASHMNTAYFSSTTSLDLVLPEGATVDISDALGLRTEDLPYDLETFNLRQTHHMKLYFIVECMGQRFEFQRQTELVILSPFYEETPPCFAEI